MDWNSVRQDLRSELGREPTDTEIASELSGRIQCIEAMCDDNEARANEEAYEKEYAEWLDKQCEDWI